MEQEEIKEDELKEEAKEESEAEAGDESDDQEVKDESKSAEDEDMKTQYMRLAADFQNCKRRSEKEKIGVVTCVNIRRKRYLKSLDLVPKS